MIGRTVFRAALALALAAAAAPPARAADAAAPPIRLVPSIRLQGAEYLIGADGMAQVPDGTVLDVSLIAAEAAQAGDLPIRTSRVSVRAGSFTLPTWTLKRADLRTVRYLLEARVARDQAPDIRLPRLAVRWKASVEIPLGDWRATCARLAPLAREMMERTLALASQRDGLRDIALAYSEKRGVGAAEWAAFKNRSGLGKALDDVVKLLDAPATEITYPQSRIKCQAIINTYRTIISGMDHLLVSESRAVQPEGSFEFWADFRTSDFARAKDTSAFLRDLEVKLSAEGVRHLVVALEEILGLVDPGTEEKPRPVKADAARAAAAGLRELLEAQRGFFEVSWSINVEDRRRMLVELIELAQKLVDESKTEPSGAAVAEAQAVRVPLWKEIAARLGVLRENLRRELGI